MFGVVTMLKRSSGDSGKELFKSRPGKPALYSVQFSLNGYLAVVAMADSQAKL